MECFECTDWNTFSAASNNLDEYSDTEISYISFCETICIVLKTVTSYSNNKPCFTKDLQQLLKKKNSACINGDGTQYKTAKYKLRKAIAKAKVNYTKKLEEKFNTNDLCSLWQDLERITNYKKNKL